jgi:hypothetical protein
VMTDMVTCRIRTASRSDAAEQTLGAGRG